MSFCNLRLFMALCLVGCSAVSGCAPERVTDPVPSESMHTVWKTAVSARNSMRGAVVTDGVRLYAQVEGISAYALDTGARLWQTRGVSVVPKNILSSGGRIFEAETIARALDADTGRELWRFEPDTAADFALSAVDDRAFYIGTRKGTLYALDINTGQPLWSVMPLEAIRYEAFVEGVVTHGDTVYASITDNTSPTGHLMRGWIVALDRYTGRVLWRYVNERAGEPHDASYHAVAGRVLLVNDRRGGAFFGLDRFTGKEVWRYVGPSNRYGAWDVFKVGDGVAYLASNDTYAYAFDPETGKIRWKTSLVGSANASAVCGDHVFISVGLLYKLRRSDGKVETSYFADQWGNVDNEWMQSQMLSHSNRLYFVTNQALYALSCE